MMHKPGKVRITIWETAIAGNRKWNLMEEHILYMPNTYFTAAYSRPGVIYPYQS